ncbi:TPA: phage tail protein [Escherichia coli]|uniref:Phage tail protein n=1 Tax=Escherichia coli TaxID=562 RepID=A0A376K0T1_ECOLX|nr:phage tail protein [Escherichia coli]QPR07358.1 phage tail protein [Escherichia coli]STE76408.1 tail fiber protein [Escherichia coli]HAI2294226.1 phage tail protein [Escherichia coli]HBD0307742.1 phage tail protein [Escherichia coli]
MAKNDFKAFATGKNANVMSQEEWEALPALLSGFTAGKASSAQVNKVIRQASFIAAALAQFVSDKTQRDVLDNGDLPGFVELLGSGFAVEYLSRKNPFGDIKSDGTVKTALENLGLQETVNKAGNAVQKTGDTLSGGLTFENDSILAWIRNTDWAKIGFKNDADSDTDSYMWFETGDNGNEYFKWRHRLAGGQLKELMNLKWDSLNILVNAVINGCLGIGTTNALGGNSIAFGDNDTGLKQNGDGLLDVYANGQHVFRFQNGSIQSNKAVNVTGRVTPSDYGNFDARYQQRNGGVQDVRYGYEMYYNPGSNTVSWTFRAPSGHGLSGVKISDTHRNSADNVDGVYYRPLQKLINGTWYNVASV